MIERDVDEIDEEGSQRRPRPGDKEILGLEAQEGQVLAGQVAAPLAQVARDVTEHVRQLERLAEADPERRHLLEVPVPETRTMGHVHLGPEFTDAARDEIRVAVELGARVERGEPALVFAWEAREVLRHAFNDGVEDAAHLPAVVGQEHPVGLQALGKPLEQRALRAEVLNAPHGMDDGFQAAALRAVELGAQRGEVRDALMAVDQPGIRDRVGGASQQIGQADGGPDGGGEDGEREVKGAADALEQGGGQVGRLHVQSPSGAGRREGSRCEAASAAAPRGVLSLSARLGATPLISNGHVR